MNAHRTTAVALCLMGGMRPCEISQVTGSTWPFIRGIRRQLGIPPFPSGRKPGEYWKPEIIQQVRELREAGLSQKQIAKRLGIHKQRVTQLMAPIKHRARAAVRVAVLRGRMTRPKSCQYCGTVCKPEAHHADYFKPFHVEWLCVSCHSLRRSNQKAA
jgi:predicted DNA-binding protein (UPF0251 family)